MQIERDLVLIGGGHAHVAVIKAFGMRAVPGVRLSVISRDLMTPYSGMVPGFLAGHYSLEQSHVDLQRLCRFASARLLHASATHIDMDGRSVHCTGRPPVAFDMLSIDTGSTPSTFGIEGAREHAIPIKPIDGFLRAVTAIEDKLRTNPGVFHIVIIGGGAGGVELCLSMQYRLTGLLIKRGENPDRVQFTLISYSAYLLPQHAASVRAHLHRELEQRGVKVRLFQPVTAIKADHLLLADGTLVNCDAAILTTHAEAPKWLRDNALARDARGFILVNNCLQSLSHENVFAAGDIAAIQGRPLAKSGVYAVRQGPVLLQNIRNKLTGKTLRPYRPQKRTLALISVGNENAVASYGRFSLHGPLIWRLKDRIDRRWMRKYQQLPEMPGVVFAQTANAPDMRCGGCGAKVAADILQRVLADLPRTSHPGVILGLNAPDDAAIIAPPIGKYLVQTADHFRAFIDDPYVMGKITATHCLNDIYAMGAEPHSALAMVTLPFGPEAKLECDLSLLLKGVCEVLETAGAPLIGGHTGEGVELSLGLAINGFSDPGSCLQKSGALAGDVLILTKPLGTGALFAADMRAKAKAQWIESAMAAMLQSSGPAAQCLREFGARACTDVSGFGLLGHLGEMLRSSQLSAAIELDSLPALPGVIETMSNGIFSTLHPANLRNGETLLNPDTHMQSHAKYDLLFDPQTAGGLLASVPQDKAEACIKALRELGYAWTAIIGGIRPREGGESLAALRASNDF